MDSPEEPPSSSHAFPISPFRLLLSMIGPVLLLFASFYLKIKIERNVIVGLIRSSLQLLFLGYVLLNLLFTLQSLPLMVLYFFMMISVAALEAVSRQQRTYALHYRDSFCACLIGGGLVGIYGNLVIFHPTPWWLPQVIIPTCGMIVGNSVSGPAIAVERLLSEVTEKSHEVETRLSFGASYYESILPIFRVSVQAALLPTLNQLAIMGLVSIPGMMTGQLLGGTPPLIAAEYQMAILYLIVTTSTISTIIAVVLAIKNAIFSLSEHRLTKSKIIKTKKTEVDTVLYQLGKNFVEQCLQFVLFRSWTSLATRSSTSSEVDYSPIQQDLESSFHGVPEGKQIELAGLPSLSSTWEDNQPFMGLVNYEILHTSKPETTSPATPPSATIILQLHDFNVKSGDNNVLFMGDGLNISIFAQEIITIEGRSGLGKTRLLRAIAGLDIPYNGYCLFQNRFFPSMLYQTDPSTQSPLQITRWDIPRWRNHIVYVPQAVSALEGIPKDLLTESINYSSRKAGASLAMRTLFAEKIDLLIAKMEERFLLPTGILSEKKWNSLSGGERQRCVIICGLLLALAIEESAFIQSLVMSDEERGHDNPLSDKKEGRVIVLLDEPCAACDSYTTLAMEQIFKETKLSMIIITHNEQQAERLAQRRVILS